MTARRAVRTLAALIAVTALVACGDDDSGSAATSTTEAPETTTESVPTEDPTTTVSPDPADEPSPDEPEDPGEDDGMGDPLVFVADLTGAAEVPGPGDDGASGRVEIESAVGGEWCIDMEATGLSADVTDSHIHFGTAGSSGDVVIPIGEPTSVDGDVDVWDDVCVEVGDELAAEILDAPQAFYANIHTVDFPPGAIRGQLEPGTIFDLELS